MTVVVLTFCASQKIQGFPRNRTSENGYYTVWYLNFAVPLSYKVVGSCTVRTYGVVFFLLPWILRYLGICLSKKYGTDSAGPCEFDTYVDRYLLPFTIHYGGWISLLREREDSVNNSELHYISPKKYLANIDLHLVCCSR